MGRIKLIRLVAVLLFALTLPIAGCHWAHGHYHHHGYHDHS